MHALLPLVRRGYRTFRAAGTTKVSMWVLAGAFAVLVATGVPLIWWYHPERQHLLRNLHTAASLVALVATVAILGSRLRALLGRRPASAGLGAVAALVVLIMLAGGTGTSLAWDLLGVEVGATTTGGRSDGILAALGPNVTRVLAADTEMDAGMYEFTAGMHLGAIPLLLGVTVWRVERYRRRAAARADDGGDDGGDDDGGEGATDDGPGRGSDGRGSAKGRSRGNVAGKGRTGKGRIGTARAGASRAGGAAATSAGTRRTTPSKRKPGTKGTSADRSASGKPGKGRGAASKGESGKGRSGAGKKGKGTTPEGGMRGTGSEPG